MIKNKIDYFSYMESAVVLYLNGWADLHNICRAFEISVEQFFAFLKTRDEIELEELKNGQHDLQNDGEVGSEFNAKKIKLLTEELTVRSKWNELPRRLEDKSLQIY
jgi:hypothetical protein